MQASVRSHFEPFAILGGELQLVIAGDAMALVLFIDLIPPWMWRVLGSSERVDVEPAIAGSHFDDEDCRLPDLPC